MGNIKTSFVKRIGQSLYDKYPGKFSREYDHNKEMVDEIINIQSKKLRNVIAGYITNLKGQEK